MRISEKEKKQYDGRVVVRFQVNVWCDELVMKFWVTSMWKRPFRKDERRKKILVADMHRAQTTEDVKQLLEKDCQTEIALVPPGVTWLIQPLDASINAEFKAYVEELQNKHMLDNLRLYVENKSTDHEMGW